MARSRKTKTNQPLTTAQRLGSLVKSARDTMRKDKGLNGDLDRENQRENQRGASIFTRRSPPRLPASSARPGGRMVDCKPRRCTSACTQSSEP
jgi:hypothetical protein